MPERKAIVASASGLHARPAALFAQGAGAEEALDKLVVLVETDLDR
ncbi:HPr family phosphocarrier protein [Arthrobacter bambusae]|nr:HPr family phosphocarrier protein [Arthrobacter bambusae]MDQ0032085.1 phosphotransferase system HPr-like phosphotransfer protein [Arthrobacter bambusae]MDQ0100225.1 phosphotransferase system HPr-like phosphotransfer protein [Arthrobacter bambusae]